MGKERDLAKIVLQKDEQIAQLDMHLQILAARASQAQVRLLSTLDTIDTLRSEHKKELALERRVTQSLSAKLESCRKHIKQAELDWDDAREALSTVLERVQLVNDYSLWPHSQIALMAPLEPLNQHKTKESERQDAESLWYTHAQAVISSLRNELEAERRAHARTREQAEADQISLNARLARREAELEAQVTCIAHSSPIAENRDGNLPRLAPQGPQTETAPKPVSSMSPVPLTSQDALKILELSAARNGALEEEVRDLIERLRIARQDAEMSRLGMSSESSNSLHEDHVSKAEQSVEILHSSRKIKSPPQSPRNGPITRSMPLRGKAPASPPETEALRGSYGDPLSASQQPSGMMQLSFSVPEDPKELLPALERLNDHVKFLSSQIDARSNEHKVLGTMSTDHKQKLRERLAGSCDDEQEHTRLRNMVDLLRGDLEAVRLAGKTREEQLLQEISTLRQAIARGGLYHHDRNGGSARISLSPSADCQVASDVSPRNVLNSASAHIDVLEDDDVQERSMELATPLQPTILSVRVDDLQGIPDQSPGDPLQVPLPDSPHSPEPSSELPSWLLPSMAASPPLHNPPVWWPHPISPSSSDSESNFEGDAIGRLDMVERELSYARQELDARDAELLELRGIVEQLMDMVYAGDATGVPTADGGDGG